MCSQRTVLSVSVPMSQEGPELLFEVFQTSEYLHVFCMVATVISIYLARFFDHVLFDKLCKL